MVGTFLYQKYQFGNILEAWQWKMLASLKAIWYFDGRLVYFVVNW
jgi:hypothetical protein